AMAVLTATDPAHLTFLERLDLVRAWERQLAWAAAGQLAAIGALEDPEPGEGADPLPEFVPDWCREEIATALHVTGTTAQNRLDLARELRTRLASTSTALRDGQLTERKAELIARAVRDLDDAVAAAVEAAVLPDAPGFTPPELQRALARIVLEVDPDGAADRAAEAVRRRRVTDVYPQPDGMGGLWAELPAADAATVLAGLDADADRIRQSLRDEGVDSSDMPDLQARRADALLAWAQRALNEPGSPTVQGRRPHVQVTRCRSARCSASTTHPVSWPATDPSTPTRAAAWLPTASGAGCSPTPTAAPCSTTAGRPTTRRQTFESTSSLATPGARSPAAGEPHDAVTSTTSTSGATAAGPVRPTCTRCAYATTPARAPAPGPCRAATTTR
ncbi:MAG: DUF222 domain-containing protein, partial [Geodermatophilaceae bacterium]|nr:DUF222 domain-containing protein [Geodermatophilaceae bacterium]